MQALEGVKKSVQEKWDGFKKKFEGAKSELSQEVMSAKSPEDLIALGKKLQAQGEALQLEEDGVKQEEAQGEGLEANKAEMIKADQIEGFEMNETFDETKAAEAAAKEKMRVAEETAAIAEAEATQLAAVRAKLSGESVKAEEAPAQESTESVAVEDAEPTIEKAQEAESIDPVELNNRIINMPHHKRQEAIENLTQEEMHAVAKNIADGSWEHTFDFLNNFNNKPEIIKQPEIIAHFKERLSSGNAHLYTIDRILSVLPESSKEEVLNDPSVRKGLVESASRAMRTSRDRSDRESFSKVIERIGFSSTELRGIET